MKTNKFKSPLVGVLAVGLVLSLVLGLVVVKSYSGEAPQNLTESGDINVTNNYIGQAEGQLGAISGLALTPNHLDAGEWTQWNDGHFDDVELEDDLWVNGDISVTGTIATIGDVRLSSLVQIGSITTLAATSTITSAQACDSRVWSIAPASTTPTYTLPASSSLFSDCLTANGDMLMISVYNVSVTSAIFAAGTGGTLEWSRASSTIDGGASGLLIMFRTSTAGGYKALMSVFGD